MFLDKDSKEFVNKLWHDLVSSQVRSKTSGNSRFFCSSCAQLVNASSTRSRFAVRSSMCATRPARYVSDRADYRWLYRSMLILLSSAALWTMDACNQPAILAIGQKMKHLLQLNEVELQYQVHKDAMVQAGPNVNAIYKM